MINENKQETKKEISPREKNIAVEIRRHTE
jgi:hypothetical protein